MRYVTCIQLTGCTVRTPRDYDDIINDIEDANSNGEVLLLTTKYVGNNVVPVAINIRQIVSVYGMEVPDE